MIAYANKTQDNKSHFTADISAKQTDSRPVAQFKNNRPEAIAQRRLQDSADNSAQVKQLNAMQQLAGNRSCKPIQAKFVIQRNGRDSQVADMPARRSLLDLEEPPEMQLDPQEPEREAPALHDSPLVDVDLESAPLRKLAPNSLPRMVMENVVTEPKHETPGWRSERRINTSGGLDYIPRGRKGVRDDAGKTTRAQKIEYGILGGGVATGSAGKYFGDSKSIWAANISPYLGLAGGGLGVAGDGYSAFKYQKEARDKANNANTRNIAGLDALSSTASAVKTGASAAAGYFDVGTAASATATTLAAGAGIAMGAFDIASGAYGTVMADRRRERLEQNMSARGDDKKFIYASKVAIETQKRESRKGMGKLYKGIYTVAGGAALLAGATPIGWALLSAAAAIGGAVAVYNYYKKRKHKKEMAIDILGIRGVRDEWKKEKKAIEKRHFWWRDARVQEMHDLGPDPLETALKLNGYSDAGHCYNNFVDTASKLLYNEGVKGGDEPSKRLIRNLGLKIIGNKEPTPSKIAAKLST